jgi:hypothetical protein
LNVTTVRDKFIRFNDTVYHKQYVPKVKPPVDLVTHQIYTWLVFAIVVLIILYAYIRFEILLKNNELNVIIAIEEKEIINEVVVPSESIEIPLQEAIEDIDDFNEIVTLNELVERRRKRQQSSKEVNEIVNEANKKDDLKNDVSISYLNNDEFKLEEQIGHLNDSQKKMSKELKNTKMVI